MSDVKQSLVIIAFDDLTEFYAIQPDIETLIKRNIPVKIMVIRSYSEQMFEDTVRVISQHGYDVLSAVDSKIECKVLLEPYPITTTVVADFRIRYEYSVSPASVKPNPCYTPEWNVPYDAVVCYSSLASDVLSVYTKPHIIRPQQFNNFRLHEIGKKTNLLILFTWGDSRTARKLIRIKELLGDDFNLMIKVHHAVQYRPDHSGIADMLKAIADEYYDSTTNVNKLFEKADIVLTDNSSAVFTAIYLGVPTAIYSEATSEYSSLNGIKAAHFSLLIEPGLVPYTNNYEKVPTIVRLALSNIEVQNRLKEDVYPSTPKDTLASVAEKYAHLDRASDPYYILRDILNKNAKSKDLALMNYKENLDKTYTQNEVLKETLTSFLSIRRSARLLTGNVKRKMSKTTIRLLKK